MISKTWPTSSVKVSFPILGMHCASCAKLIEKRLAKVKGIISSHVSYGGETASIEVGDDFKKDILTKTIESMGYKVGINTS